jgi:hypothetical protein
MRRNRRPGIVRGATVTLVTKNRRGTWLGVPYDWRRPTWKRIRRRWWNPRVNRLFTPRAFGWGYDINVAALLRRLHLR